jgi:hypothetical protein
MDISKNIRPLKGHTHKKDAKRTLIINFIAMSAMCFRVSALCSEADGVRKVRHFCDRKGF